MTGMEGWRAAGYTLFFSSQCALVWAWHHDSEGRRKSWAIIYSTDCSSPYVLQSWRRGLLLQEEKKSGHTVEIISAVWLTTAPPSSLFSLLVSLSLSHSLCEAPADSGCIHPYINHSPYSIGYMVHGKYWFFPLPHCWKTLGFCETEKGKTKKPKPHKKYLYQSFV